MHADETETDIALVRRLLAEQFPDWADLPLEPVANSGTVNALYRLGADLVVRLPRVRDRRSPMCSLAHEFRLLPALAPLLSVTLPAPVAKGAPAAGYPHEWAVYRWLDGENPRPGDVDWLAPELAAFIRELRRVPLPGPPVGRAPALSYWDGFTRANLEVLDGVVDTGAAAALWEEALRVPPWTGPPVWVHGDVMPGNLLVRDGRLAAVIDWGGAGVGDPACDLMVAWNLLGPEGRVVFREVVGVDDDTWGRGHGWALWTGLGAQTYYRETNPAFAAQGRRTVVEILAEAT
jgi:aminoglycoside phosphotransferase (APT) family kinase protein